MKTLIKTLAAAALTLLSVTAFAAPPYHINGTAAVGTATFVSSGTCKVPMKKFAGAQYGSIYDSGNNSVGTGVIDATGSTILAFGAGGMMSYMKYFVDNNAPQKVDIKMRASFMDTTNVAGYVMAQSGCTMMSWWTQPSSFFQVKQDLAKGTMDVAMKQSFIGDIQPDLNHCTSVNNVVKCNKSLQFKGSMSFKGRALIP
ncbi:MAG: hypothetical protein IPN27_07685 [Cellvibrionales bacterium]|nr:hypothetical protein [Cellvibrionales bacterium]